MRCLHIDARKACLIVLTFFINGAKHAQLGDNTMDIDHKSGPYKETNTNANVWPIRTDNINTVMEYCRRNVKECSQIPASCLSCNLTTNCIYGKEYNATCTALDLSCKGERVFTKQYICRYCYQTPVWEHSCDLKANCNSVAINRSKYVTNCTVHNDVLCLGLRTFNKNVLCNWTGGYRWSTALILSITLGGFGADRFYLGHWQEGIGKLFSFGGLGVWTLIDVILISLHYLGPADGSLYI